MTNFGEQKKPRYLSVDPSGSGTTGLFFWNSENNEEHSTKFKNKNWKEHFLFLKDFCENNQIDYLIYETTNFIKVRGNDLTSLFKFFGIIEAMPYLIENVKFCETVFVKDVKTLQKKLKEGSVIMKNIFFKPGRGGGWFRKEKKIDVHEADAFIVLYQYLKKEKPELNFE